MIERIAILPCKVGRIHRETLLWVTLSSHSCKITKTIPFEITKVINLGCNANRDNVLV